MFPRFFSTLSTLTAVLSLLLLTGCGQSGTQIAASRADASVQAYLAALETHPGDLSNIDAGIQSFSRVYEDLTAPEIESLIDEAYAPNLFFNDTLHTFKTREELKAYMAQTGQNLTRSEVEIHQIITQGTDVFVRWTMYFQVGDDEEAIRSNSIGISHLRFDEKGQVVLHQDYWDSSGALYSHLPIVGSIIRAAQDQVGQPK